MSLPPTPLPSSDRDPYAAFRERDFRLYVGGKLACDIGVQMQAVAVSWEMYEITGSSLHLGLVGLAQVLPIVLFTLPAGQIADVVSRRAIVIVSQCVLALCAAGLAVASSSGSGILPMYAFLVLSGFARAFLQPARSALLPQIVSPQRFTSAVTWNVTAYQLSAVVGPALGGFLIAWRRQPAIVYGLDALCALVFVALLNFVRRPPVDAARERFTWRALLQSLRSLSDLLAGARYVWREPVILGSLSLDLFAVLCGGATALLPVYARDLLIVGPAGLGWMRAAPSLGAILTTLLMTHRPPIERAGRTLLLSVLGFGAATIVFGFSRSFALSMAMLFLTGAFDMVSVVIRHTLVQIMTPDELRGRVSAVNGLFISLSNQLGEFESGMVAHLWTATISVVAGGTGALLVVALTAWLCPALRVYGRMSQR